VYAVEQKGPGEGDYVRIEASEYLARDKDPLPLSPGP